MIDEIILFVVVVASLQYLREKNLFTEVETVTCPQCGQYNVGNYCGLCGREMETKTIEPVIPREPRKEIAKCIAPDDVEVIENPYRREAWRELAEEPKEDKDLQLESEKSGDSR